MDKAWKAFERDVAAYFGTTRAIHGLSREAGEGEVKTDVFVNAQKWYRHLGLEPGYIEAQSPVAIVVECKHSKKPGHPNRRLLTRIHAEKKKVGVPVMLKTPDGWSWIQLADFRQFYSSCVEVACAQWHVIEDTRKTAKFFKDAIEQARQALIPDEERDFKFKRRMHIVCTGSNIRVPHIVGIPPDCIQKLG